MPSQHGPDFSEVNAATAQAIGGRRPSWMHSNMYPNLMGSQSARQQIKPARIVSSNASISPQLANVVSHHVSAPSPTGVLLSPSPSEEASCDQPASAALAFNTTREAGPEPQSYRPDDAATRKRHSEQGPSEPPGKRVRVEPSGQTRPTPLFALPNQPESRRTSAHQTALVPSTRTASHGSMQQSPMMSQGGSNPQSPLQSELQRPAASGLGWYTKEQCLSVLNSFRKHFPVLDKNVLDAKRLELVEEAVQKLDSSYLIMHQYYCLLITAPEMVPEHIRNHRNIQSAIVMITHMLDSNVSLSPPTLEFFAQFPGSRAYLLGNYPQTLVRVEATLLKLFDLSPNFSILRETWRSRDFPPLMRELFYDLGIISVVFQQVVFTSVLRNLWALWGGSAGQPQLAFEVSASGILYECQQDFYQRQTPYNPNSETEKRERSREMQMWGVSLQKLCYGYRAILRSTSTIPRELVEQQFHQQTQSPRQVQQQRIQQQAQQLQQKTNHQQIVQQQPMQQANQQYAQLQLQLQARQHQIQQQSGQQSVQPELHGHHSNSVAARAFINVTQAPPPDSAQGAVQRGRPRGRPRLYQSQLRPQPSPVNHQDMSSSDSTPLLAQRGFVLPQARVPDPARSATHQAYLRSPTLEANPGQAPLYQYVKGFIKGPMRLEEAGFKIEKWTFNLTREDLQSVPTNRESDLGAPPTRQINEKSQMFRLRSVKWTSEIPPNEHLWSVADTSWIPFSYFTFNGEILQQRKKPHHGKDLPIDLTEYLKEGENILEIAIMRQRNDDTYRKYLVAIEKLGIKSHSTILNECRTKKHLDAAITKAHIERKLSRTTDDDEVTIVKSNVVINMFDPISASRMCDVPARGEACLHYDCFDLETFLSTRKKAGPATVVDNWKCPICNCDARPQHLVVDGFIEEVRDMLVEQGLQQTRAITIDGTLAWEAKREARDSVPDRDMSNGKESVASSRRSSGLANKSQIPVHVEVIELD
ncbi:hypothetical protein P280DRAFT_83693 [Massarina eburnea CBS 473.64]|uniref:SP-RING-type domain-containing protein n=1 Tax=Massarina eburnea CBS 473.64 TaxID=1395130 RepID=A0A6A6RSB0_9PLEO|nr:hypothetical protein P280DRAFT_83693 [Massarina eburnea CBS 473.64]